MTRHRTVADRAAGPVFRATASAALLWLLLALPGGAAGWARAAETGELATLRTAALDRVNQERQGRDLAPLALDPTLSEAAQAHAEDMLRRGYYGHASPEGGTVLDRFIAAGGSRWRLLEENIARCPECDPPPTPAAVARLHRGWMDSRDHRANILDPGIDRFGFGIVAGPDRGLYAVQTFAGPGRPRGAAADQETPALSPDELNAGALERINRARRQAGQTPLAASPALTQAARSLLPQDGLDDVRLPAADGIFAALPSDERAAWRSADLIAGSCGGCGVRPTEADLRFFVDRWLDHPEHRRILLDPERTHLGFALAANGDGRKVALAVLGRRR